MGRQLTLVLGRLRSTAPKSKGSVLVNFGGPAGISIDLMRKHGGQAFAGLRQRMDIVTWDIRGGPLVPGLSTSLPCAWRSTRIQALPRNQHEFDLLAAASRARAEECRVKDPELFANMSSADSPRDLEARVRGREPGRGAGTAQRVDQARRSWTHAVPGEHCARALIDSYFTDRKLPPNGSDC